MADRIVFDKLIEILVLCASYNRIADDSCSATTIRRRRDDWITAGIFTALESAALAAYNKMVGPGPDPHMRGRLHRQGALRWAGRGPILGGQGKAGNRALAGSRRPWHAHRGWIAPANRHDSPLLAPTLETGLGRFGFDTPPERITIHLDAGYDSDKTRRLLEVLGCDHVISRKGEPLQAGARWLWIVRGLGVLRAREDPCYRTQRAVTPMSCGSGPRGWRWRRWPALCESRELSSGSPMRMSWGPSARLCAPGSRTPGSTQASEWEPPRRTQRGAKN